MRPDELFFEMAIVDGSGRVHAKLRRQIHEDAAYMGDRIVEEMRLGADLGVGLVSFDEAVRVMRRREFRRDLLTSAAAQCGSALADYLEDKEGWHGIDRQEWIKDRELVR
jgi:hypothetical protein